MYCGDAGAGRHKGCLWLLIAKRTWNTHCLRGYTRPVLYRAVIARILQNVNHLYTIRMIDEVPYRVPHQLFELPASPSPSLIVYSAHDVVFWRIRESSKTITPSRAYSVP